MQRDPKSVRKRKQEQYAKYGEEHFAEASRAAVEAMIADIGTALERAK